MRKHSLVCLLKDDKKSSFRTARASSLPSMEKLREIYFHNSSVVQYLLDYCNNNSIKSLRVTSNLFPLASYNTYREKALNLLDEVGAEYAKLNYYDVELSSHPDQFILLSSLNPNINAASRYELGIYGHMSQYIPWNLINIHVGSRAGGIEEHKKIMKREVPLLDSSIKPLLSLENDEKSYSFLDTLEIAEENGLMMVPDFHHERCLQKRKIENCETISQEQHIVLNKEIDETIYANLDRVIATYAGKSASPTFHISSPINGWNGKFKDQCAHADYIAYLDYPHLLENYMKERNISYRLDLEAKAKNEALLKIEKELIA